MRYRPSSWGREPVALPDIAPVLVPRLPGEPASDKHWYRHDCHVVIVSVACFAAPPGIASVLGGALVEHATLQYVPEGALLVVYCQQRCVSMMAYTLQHYRIGVLMLYIFCDCLLQLQVQLSRHCISHLRWVRSSQVRRCPVAFVTACGGTSL